MFLNHIAIIVSSEKSIEFYKQFGYQVISREERPNKNDILVFMQGQNSTLEIFVKPNVPKRQTNSEAYGLRHLCFETDNINKFKFDEPIRKNPEGKRFSFIHDPDGLPIEIVEKN